MKTELFRLSYPDSSWTPPDNLGDDYRPTVRSPRPDLFIFWSDTGTHRAVWHCGHFDI